MDIGIARYEKSYIGALALAELNNLVVLKFVAIDDRAYNCMRATLFFQKQLAVTLRISWSDLKTATGNKKHAADSIKHAAKCGHLFSPLSEQYY